MTLRSLLLYLIITPSFLFSLTQQDVDKCNNDGSNRLKKAEKCLKRLNYLKDGDIDGRIKLLEDATNWQTNAKSAFDYIIDNVNKIKKRKRLAWQNEEKAKAEESRHIILESLAHFKAELINCQALKKTASFFDEYHKKINKADEIIYSDFYDITNPEKVITTLNQLIQLYKEAQPFAQKALDIISASSLESQKASLLTGIANCEFNISKYQKEIEILPEKISVKISELQKQRNTLQASVALLKEKDLTRGCYQLLKERRLVLEQLLKFIPESEHELIQQELDGVVTTIYETELELKKNRLIPVEDVHFVKELAEKEKRAYFYTSNSITSPEGFVNSIQEKPIDQVCALDGQVKKKGDSYALYKDQFYRFLIQSEFPVSNLWVHVSQGGESLHSEKVSISEQGSDQWEQDFQENGMLLTPQTQLKNLFGLDLRLHLSADLDQNSIVIVHKGDSQDFQFTFSLSEDQKLYDICLLESPPWQLEALKKPKLTNAFESIKKTDPSTAQSVYETNIQANAYAKMLKEAKHPLLDKFVEQLKNDPMAIASYVQNEIAFVDPFCCYENDSFCPPSISRTAAMTFLDRSGSPWEQCQLLVYLLRKAGYKALYQEGGECILDKTKFEKMILKKIKGESDQVSAKYPWVVFFNGKEWISLFPWLKDVQVSEGYDLYNLMPEEFATADRWIESYLKRDERILKHIGSDEDDTLGSLFPRFVEEEVKKQGLTIDDVGIKCSILKKQFSNWSNFPRPLKVRGKPSSLHDLNESLFSAISIDISSSEDPSKKIDQIVMPLCCLNNASIPFEFFQEGPNTNLKTQLIGDIDLLSLQLAPGITASSNIAERLLVLDKNDKTINVNIHLTISFSETEMSYDREYSQSLIKDTPAVLCFDFGQGSLDTTSQFYERLSFALDEKEHLNALLALVGSIYFEKCGRAGKVLADLHKVKSNTIFSFGFVKLAGNLSNSMENNGKVFPQVDMYNNTYIPEHNVSVLKSWSNENYISQRQYEILSCVHLSSCEHQVIQDFFQDPYAVSTVRLLQLAQLHHQISNVSGSGFLKLTPKKLAKFKEDPQKAQDDFFPNLKAFDLSQTMDFSTPIWVKSSNLLYSKYAPGSYIYATAGPVSSLNQANKESAVLLFSQNFNAALLTNYHLVVNGGLGSGFSRAFVFSLGKDPLSHAVDATLNRSNEKYFAPIEQSSDVRPDHKSLLSLVADPVDVVTGAFYIDEVDLSLPGPFPLEVRRNYNSLNSLAGDLGYGWKLSLNPYLIEQDGMLYAAELDGTVIKYRFNEEASRWEVFPGDNPELWNNNQTGIGGVANPFHAYIQDNILYGTNGSIRVFEDGLLKEWKDAKGNTLIFEYSNRKLIRIESSNGHFCIFEYNSNGKITKIFSKDGRILHYTYNFDGDLVGVELPNGATISYEYDYQHHITRESKVGGRILENIYDDKGRVVEQRGPVGLQQQMTVSASFIYMDGETRVIDGKGGETVYKIFQKQIYKITDPMGISTFEAWFLDDSTWFDPITEKVCEWNEKGIYPRSLKSSINKRGLETYYHYDEDGNPIEIGYRGEDLTGDGQTCAVKKYKYNSHKLCIEETVSSQTLTTQYDPSCPYLPATLTKPIQNFIYTPVHLVYDEKNQLITEICSHAETKWEYDSRGFPIKRIETVGELQPEQETSYSYNDQGQCVFVATDNGYQEDIYDIMGNNIQSELFSSCGDLLSARYTGYNLNNDPTWEHTGNNNAVHRFEYNTSGLIKASSCTLSPGQTACSLFDYDERGCNIKESDPKGYETYRDYDAIGRVIKEEKEGRVQYFTYEPGGLLESIRTPLGHETTFKYTTTGLLKEKLAPDGAQSFFVYDDLGRLIKETHNGISWEIQYDSQNRKIIRTHVNTQLSETQEFDELGNEISFTDRAGHTYRKTYDQLSRLKTEISPGGDVTLWEYENDCISCTHPNGERAINRYAGEKLVETKLLDVSNNVISETVYKYDPKTDTEEIVQGNEIATVTTFNALNQPIKIQQGDLTTNYKYDLCGNCIFSSDSENLQIHMSYDAFGNLTEKILSDGTSVRYIYDLEGNLIEYHLPNGAKWIATYDNMARKASEELKAGHACTQKWSYTYKNGFLSEIINPLGKNHLYSYDSLGRLTEEKIDHWRRKYTYDSRDLLTSVSQTKENGLLTSFVYGSDAESSLIERSYDSEGRLTQESISLNSKLLQETKQSWKCGERSLQIGSHHRRFTYQHGRLKEVTTPNFYSSYEYDLSGLLKTKKCPSFSQTVSYTPSALPEKIVTKQSRQKDFHEDLNWDLAGRLSCYTSSQKQENFQYGLNGYLESSAKDTFEFDFGSSGMGVLTQSQNQLISQNGLDPFGKIINETIHGQDLLSEYDAAGQLTSQNEKEFEWDPWGRLTKVSCLDYSWEASYDAFGRRLQTQYTPQDSSPLISTSFYDPEEEFQEIGVQVNDKTFWKIYGNDTCEAVIDDHGNSITLFHNALGQLSSVCSQGEIEDCDQLVSLYGPQATPPLPIDLLSYAKSLSWRSYQVDPTGLIWMGARYYSPMSKRFLSPDPIGITSCLNLYTYALGDPVNFRDPDGRFSSPVYRKIEGMYIGACKNPMSAAIGVGHGAADYIYGQFQHFREYSYYTGLGTLGDILDVNERCQLMQSFQNVQDKQSLRAEAAIQGFLGADISDSTYQSYRSVSRGGLEVASIVIPAYGAVKGLTGASKMRKALPYALKRARRNPLTRTKIRNYLQNTSKLSKSEIVFDLESIGLKVKGNRVDRPFLEFVDRRGRLRAKLHPPDKSPKGTRYPHLHIYDQRGNSLDRNLQIVSWKSKAAHIPIGE